MQKTVKLNELAKELNNASFDMFLDSIEWKNDETQNGLIVITAETNVGQFFYNVFFTFANGEITIDDQQDFLDGLWHVEGAEVIDENGEPVDRFEVPSEFPAAATAIDFEKLKNDLEAR